jgi:hypothetical protein
VTRPDGWRAVVDAPESADDDLLGRADPTAGWGPELVPARRVLDDLPRWMPGGLLTAFGRFGRCAAVAVLASVAWLLPGWPAAQPEVSTSLGSSAGAPDEAA